MPQGAGVMQINCSSCAYGTEIDGELLPAAGMEGICPLCRSTIPLGGWQAGPETTAVSAEPPQSAIVYEPDDLPPEGKVSLINIIVLLTIVDSTMSLISRLPGLSAVLGGGTGMTFHQEAKYLYDTLMAAGFFVAAFGLMALRNWARLMIIWLFSLGLAEGLYMLVYQQFAIAELERNLREGFPELKRQQNAKLLGCALYGFFIYKLSSGSLKRRFCQAGAGPLIRQAPGR